MTEFTTIRMVFLRFIVFASFVASFSMASCMTASAATDACIGDINYWAGLPVIDGQVEGDPGWLKAVRINFPLQEYEQLGLSSGPLGAVYQMGYTADSVYLSIEVTASELSQGLNNDTVVLAFESKNPNGTANDWLIQLRPFPSNIPSGSMAPNLVTYWRGNSANWNTQTQAYYPAPNHWVYQNTKIRVDPTTQQWSLEMKIPRVIDANSQDGIVFLPDQPMKVYINVIDTMTLPEGSSGDTFRQAPWPADAAIMPPSDCSPLDMCKVERNTPSKVKWGTVSLFKRNECTGLYLADIIDVGTKNPDSSTILYSLPPNCGSLTDPNTKAGPVNTFFAKPFNGMSIDATNVTTRFWIRNFGIANPDTANWTPIGPDTNSTGRTPAITILHNQRGEMTYPWQLTKQQACIYDQHPDHQCILAMMESSDPNVRFLNRGAYNNTRFVKASEFIGDAEISGIGYGRPPQGRANHQFLITVDKSVEQYQREGDRYIGKRTLRLRDDLRSKASKLLSKYRGNDLQKQEASKIVEGNIKNIVSVKGNSVPVSLFPHGVAEAMTSVTRGYLLKGRYLVINGQKYEEANYVGGYSYVVSHEGRAPKWSGDITGNNLKNISSKILSPKAPTERREVYMLEIPPEKVAKITTRVKADDKVINRPPVGKVIVPRDERLNPSQGSSLNDRVITPRIINR